MLKNLKTIAFAAMALVMGNAAMAQSNFTPVRNDDGDITGGSGFAAKGDVQLAMGWNNKSYQDNAAALEITVKISSITDITWDCLGNDGTTNERTRVLTESEIVTVNAFVRFKNQITGQSLNFVKMKVQDPKYSGPQLNSCPGNSTYVTNSTIYAPPYDEIKFELELDALKGEIVL
jgi:hypothetical protein